MSTATCVFGILTGIVKREFTQIQKSLFRAKKFPGKNHLLESLTIKVIIFEKKKENSQKVLRAQSICKCSKLGWKGRVLTLRVNARLDLRIQKFKNGPKGLRI